MEKRTYYLTKSGFITRLENENERYISEISAYDPTTGEKIASLGYNMHKYQPCWIDYINISKKDTEIYTGLGIGCAMIEYLVEKIKKGPYEQKIYGLFQPYGENQARSERFWKERGFSIYQGTAENDKSTIFIDLDKTEFKSQSQDISNNKEILDTFFDILDLEDQNI